MYEMKKEYFTGIQIVDEEHVDEEHAKLLVDHILNLNTQIGK